MRHLDWTETAESDKDGIVDYIAQENILAAVEIGDAIERQTEALQKFPDIGRPGRIKGTRELVIKGLSYIVCYATDDSSVTVLRVLHGRQQWPKNV
jgi:addiction module RelE/StbE family toxin